MKYEVVPNSCRICLRRSPKMRSIYKPLEEGDEPPHEMLWLITGVTLEEANKKIALPKNICKNCELSLNLAIQFRMRALKSQRIIEIFWNQLQTSIAANSIQTQENRSMPKVKQELEEFIEIHESMEEKDYVSEEPLCSPQKMKVEMLDLSFSDEEDSTEIDDVNKVEYLEDIEYFDTLPHNKASIQMVGEQYTTHSIESQDETDESVKNYSQETTQSDLATSVHSKIKSRTNNEIAQVSPVKRLRRTKRVIIGAKCTSVKRKSSTSDSELSKQHKLAKNTSKPTNENTSHICDICGNIYAKRGRMMEHRRRHDKELKYACELCDKRFHLREKLRKHMYSHKGGKPHKCSFCSRTFFYESVKKAHEKVHSGYKPYVCEQCNKAFAYAHALSKHMLIHADIKLYHCEYCNKDFRLQHHMKQHIETKLHKNAVRDAAELDHSSEKTSTTKNPPVTSTITTIASH